MDERLHAEPVAIPVLLVVVRQAVPIQVLIVQGRGHLRGLAVRDGHRRGENGA